MPGHAIVDLRNTYGCAFIGLVISAMLFGITICQTWIYYWVYGKRDSKSLKSFILIILLLDTFHTFLCIYAIYWYLILNFVNVKNLGHDMWAMDLQVDISGLVNYLVQLYYARRVYIVSNSLTIPVIIVLLGANCFALFFVFAARAAVIKNWAHATGLIPLSCVGLGSGVLADALIAFSMCWYLYHKRTGFARTDSMIMTLMGYSISSGLLTCILTTGVLIAFSARPSSMICQIFNWPMAKIYANSLLAMLNSRDHVHERSTTDNTENSFNLSSLIRPKGDDAANRSNSNPATVSISTQHSETTDFRVPETKRDHDVEIGIMTEGHRSKPTYPPNTIATCQD